MIVAVPSHRSRVQDGKSIFLVVVILKGPKLLGNLPFGILSKPVSAGWATGITGSQNTTFNSKQKRSTKEPPLLMLYIGYAALFRLVIPTSSSRPEPRSHAATGTDTTTGVTRKFGSQSGPDCGQLESDPV